jgi:hypothetical protein
MGRNPRKYKGKYYGKFRTRTEVALFKEEIINRYNKTPYEKRNISTLLTDLQEQGYQITYNTLRTWLKRSEVVIVRNVQKGPEKQLISTNIDIGIAETLDQFREHISKTDLFANAISMLLGLSVENFVVIFFKEGNVVITQRKDKLVAVTTNNLKAPDLRFLQGLVTLAEQQDDWVHFVQTYCRASGVQFYPLL